MRHFDYVQRIGRPLLPVLCLLSGGCGGSVVSGQSSRAPALPALQKSFCDRYKAAFAEYDRLMPARDAERNPIRVKVIQQQIDAIHDKLWDDEFAIIGPTGEFKDWRGPNPSFFDAGGNMMSFWVNACPTGPDNVLLHTKDETNIPLVSPLGNVLASLNMKKEVLVSGRFVFPPKERNHFIPGGSTYSIYWRSIAALRVRFSSISQAP